MNIEVFTGEFFACKNLNQREKFYLRRSLYLYANCKYMTYLFTEISIIGWLVFATTVVRFLFTGDLFSVCFLELFGFPLSRWSSLDILYSTLAFSCFLSSSSRCVLHILRPIKPHFAFFSTRSAPIKFFLSLVYFHLRPFLHELEL